MKKILSLSFAFLAVASVPTSAMALQSGQALEVRIDTGAQQEAEAGTMVPYLVASSAQYCDYYVEWINEQESISTSCLIRERKTLGHASCLDNEDDQFNTVITDNPNFDCTGFNQFGLDRTVETLLASESAEGDAISGILELEDTFIPLSFSAG